MLNFYLYRTPRLPKPKRPKYPAVFIYKDAWDDFGFKTLFYVTVQLSASEEEIDIGEVKILEISKSKVVYRPQIETRFEQLNSNFCSVGQSVRYYRHLRDKLPSKIRKEYLRKLQDIVAKPSRRKRFERDIGFEVALLRTSGARDALNFGGQYIGYPFEKMITPSFEFETSLPGSESPHKLKFDFSSQHDLPHRINLLIGRNGTGKTQVLARLARTLYGPEKTSGHREAVAGEIMNGQADFSKIIAVSYSAFDEFLVPHTRRSQARKSRFNYKYCGLKNASGAIDVNGLKSMLDNSMKAVEGEDRGDILEKLLGRIIGAEATEGFVENTKVRSKIFSQLSAGQRFIVAVTADILGFIENRSILLFDEPETHLHPGLLSTLVAMLNEILNEFQSFAVIATHSPILLQQVPKRYVHVFVRKGLNTKIRAPKSETFGEDLGELTRQTLGLTEPETDFHDFLHKLVDEGKTAQQVEAMFDQDLPLPAQIYLESIITQRDE